MSDIYISVIPGVTSCDEHLKKNAFYELDVSYARQHTFLKV